MKKIVHLDFKGAPPKIPFLEQIILSIKRWGATGLLIEWEDTFPYDGMLVDVGSRQCGDKMYSEAEVKHILQFAQNNELEVIQLIQTMGHMEFILKHPTFLSLRENPRAPASLCPLRARSQLLLRDMAEQVLGIQPGATFLHLGADEVWNLGSCPDCQAELKRSGGQPYKLFLRHISSLARSIKDLHPKVTLLIWDDMLRGIPVEDLIAHNLGELVQPVVWNYNIHENLVIPRELWSNYRLVFRRCWAASAYKGANGSCQIVSPVKRYVSNHMGWMREILQYGNETNFVGIILTGWSRYDHYATLCELLPVAMPSLANCLKTIAEMSTGHCKEIQLKELTEDDSEWPGYEAAIAIEKFAGIRDRCRLLLYEDTVSTWLNPWQIANNFTNPMHVDSIARNAHQLQSELYLIQPKLQRCLQNITGPRSSDEWMNTLVTPLMAHINSLYVEADRRRNMDAAAAPSGYRELGK